MAEEAIYSFVLEGIKLVIEEAQFLHGVGDQVESLQQRLNEMHWFLRDTSSASQDGQKRVLQWVLRVRDLAYQAENLVESYAFKVASRSGGGIGAKIKRFAGILNECYLRHKIGSDIETLMSKMNDLTTSLNQHGIRHILENRENNGAPPRRPLLRSTYSTTNDEDDLFVGSDEAIRSLAEQLVDDQYRTFSLYGMGGLGKTTIARKVYNHPTVRKHFDGFSWVSISQQWQKHDILRGVLIKLMPEHKRDEISKWRDDELVRELSQFLLTTKCLVVLDDIWSIDAWMSIEPAIPIRENGSKVMITTRNMEVATLLDGHGYRHNPRLLTMDESWELLCKKALRGKDSDGIMKMEAIGKEMITHCSGLPLAVMTLGGILSSRHSYDEWQIVLDNIKSYLRIDDRHNVYGILTMSYDDLPFQLKPCFLYLSHYPEDEDIEAETLYQYWMAEGMVSRDDMFGSNETMMDVAEHYLRELADRSMVFVEKVEGYSYRRFKSCQLHDLIRDVCISKAKEERFFESIDYRYIHDAAEASKRTTSRLSIYINEEDEAKTFVPPAAKAVSRSLRSFILELNVFSSERRTWSLNIRLGEFLMLRILSLQGKFTSNDLSRSIGGSCINNIEAVELPSSIGKLVHLRYFRLVEAPSLIVPSSIGNLKQLQTLDFRNCNIQWMPNVLWKMAQLTHLYLPYGDRVPLVEKLRLDGLHKLEILEGFENKVCNVNHLSTLTNLRELQANLNNNLEDMEEFTKHVRKLTHLRVLTLRIHADLWSENAFPIINNILSYSYLVSLDIVGKISEWAQLDWGFCRKLQSLDLSVSAMEDDPLSALGRLPELRSLRFWWNSFVGKEMSCHAFDFPQLRELGLGGLHNLERWEIEDGAMPNLSKLSISHCKRLVTIPSGLRFITSLKIFEAEKMSEEFKENLELDLFDQVSHIQTITYIN